MQIFLPFLDIIEVAICLDKRRLHKQIVECKQIAKAITGESQSWKNHPVTKMYQNNLGFVNAYTKVLEKYWQLYKEGKDDTLIKEDIEIQSLNKEAMNLLPSFVKNEEYLNTMKGRLFIKDSVHYANLASYTQYGDKNMYFVDGEWKFYKQKV